MDWKLALDVVLNLIMFSVAIYAIRDARKKASEALFLERNRSYAKIRNDMVWLYADPTENAHSADIAEGMEQFCISAQAAEPDKWTVEDLKGAVENQSLHFADTLVKGGYATWKDGIDTGAVELRLRRWQTDSNRVRIENLLKKNFLF
jgi:hypothetical protein